MPSSMLQPCLIVQRHTSGLRHFVDVRDASLHLLSPNQRGTEDGMPRGFPSSSKPRQ